MESAVMSTRHANHHHAAVGLKQNDQSGCQGEYNISKYQIILHFILIYTSIKMHTKSLEILKLYFPDGF